MTLRFFPGDADTYYYTNQGAAPVIDGVDDAEELMNTREAFSLLGKLINQPFQTEVIKKPLNIPH